MQTNELHATDTAANDADGRHIRKIAGWVHVFDALSVGLFELAASTKLVPAEHRDGARNSEPKELVVLGTAREERRGNGDRQGKGSDAATQKQQQREEIALVVVHRALLLGGETFGGSLALALVQSDQRLPKLEVRALGDASGQVANGRLLALANRRDVLLSEVARLEVRYE